MTRRRHRAEFSPPEARGTLRMALEKTGFDAASVRADQLAGVVRSVMPRELQIRGVDAPADVCESIVDALAKVKDGGLGPAAERFLERTRS
ncbi:MAG TPA: hypothetical protein VMW35_14675 [Myxococcota bacterium]|nr:hypothetical protein [Myxococcota bacterium]